MIYTNYTSIAKYKYNNGNHMGKEVSRRASYSAAKSATFLLQ
jgi:hypothetical protein